MNSKIDPCAIRFRIFLIVKHILSCKGMLGFVCTLVKPWRVYQAPSLQISGLRSAPYPTELWVIHVSGMSVWKVGQMRAMCEWDTELAELVVCFYIPHRDNCLMWRWMVQYDVFWGLWGDWFLTGYEWYRTKYM